MPHEAGVQAGDSPKDTNGNPSADAGAGDQTAKKDGNDAIDYRGFFEQQVQAEQARLADLGKKASESKDERERLQFEREAFEIEKKLHSMGIGKETPPAVPNDLPAGAQDFLKDITKGMSAKDAQNIYEFAKQFAGQISGVQAPNPANLNDRPGNNSNPVNNGQMPGVTGQDIVKSEESKRAFLQLFSNVVAAEQQRR